MMKIWKDNYYPRLKKIYDEIGHPYTAELKQYIRTSASNSTDNNNINNNQNNNNGGGDN